MGKTLADQDQTFFQVLVEDARLCHHLLVARADLLPYGGDDTLVARSDVVSGGRKLNVHLVPELRDLPSELFYPRWQLFENRHSLFQSFYTSIKGLRRHIVSIRPLRRDEI
jgi:hypothetical protein